MANRYDRHSYMLKGGTSDVTILDSLKAYRPVNITFDVLTNRDTTRAMVDCGDFSFLSPYVS